MKARTEKNEVLFMNVDDDDDDFLYSAGIRLSWALMALNLYSALSCLRLLKALLILLPGHWRAIQAIAYAAI